MRIAVLGSTGSIGTSCLDVIAANPERLELVGVTAHRRWELLAEQCRTFKPRWAVLSDETQHAAVSTAQASSTQWPRETELLVGPDAVERLAAHPEVDTVVCGIVGAAGLRGAWAAVESGKRVAIANNVGASLFISLHLDAHPSPAVAGPRAVVARNRIGPGAGVPGPLADLGFAAWSEGQREAWPRAYQLADRLVTELSEALDVPSRGVEEWPLPILSAASMPAVYLDVATLTAPGAEARVTGQRDVVINAIIRAVDRYRRETR